MKRKRVILLLTLTMLFGGCTKPSNGEIMDTNPKDTIVDSTSSGIADSSVEAKSYEEMFTDRDLEVGYEESECVSITMSGNTAVCGEESVQIAENQITITAEGEYLLTGEFTGSIVVEAGEQEKVRLILDDVSVQNDGGAPIYLKQADKVFITLANESNNTIKNTGEFEQIDENNIDGAIFAKCDLTLNGLGDLKIDSETGSGIVSKDDLVITGGLYEIVSAKHGIEGKDSIRIANGNVEIACVKDGLHSDNQDEGKGFVYIAGGNINITKSYEGMEAKVIEIAGGEISIVSGDDGLNAASDNRQETVYILITGGKTTVRTEGDGLDSNGYLYVTGGEVYVSGPEKSGNGALDYQYGGQITGGIVLAAGSGGMAGNFGNTSTQGSILVNTQTSYEAGTRIALSAEGGEELISYEPTAKFSSVVISCPEIEVGKNYVLTIGSDSQTIVMDEIIYGEGTGFGGKGQGGMHDREEWGVKPGKGQMPQDGQMPDGEIPQRPDWGDMPEKPDMENRPEMQEKPENQNGLENENGKEDDL